MIDASRKPEEHCRGRAGFETVVGVAGADFHRLLCHIAVGWPRNMAKAPPIPERVVAVDGSLLFTRAQIERGQATWMSAGGQELGSLWGHGSYVAPDWSADWLHREAVALRERWALQDFGKSYDTLDLDSKALLDG